MDNIEEVDYNNNKEDYKRRTIQSYLENDKTRRSGEKVNPCNPNNNSTIVSKVIEKDKKKRINENYKKSLTKENRRWQSWE